MSVLSNRMQNAMNEQVKDELYSAYLYLSMSAYSESANLPGFARWMRLQAQEEVEHAMKFYHFIADRGGQVLLKAIDQPPIEFQSPVDLFQMTLEHEQTVTGLIHDLYALAVQDNDYASQVFLQWFVAEQVEEEQAAGQILDTLKMIGDKGQALIMLDIQLARRGGD